MNPINKYRPFPKIDLPNRQWPNNQINKAPIWLSTDLRDGNQALVDPMDSAKKQRFFDLLVSIGVKEIEVGFPSASSTDFNYVRSLVDDSKIPDDVVIQALTQSRRDLIEKTFESMAGAKKAIVHLYNAVSPAWRDVVFKLDKQEVKQIAINGAEILAEQAAKYPQTDWHFEYSPETFSTAELDFSLEVCEAVMEVLKPSKDKRLILNLPATVEASTPNIYADQIEWFCNNISAREKVIISLHPHNDRGSGIAAAELGLMAGADRIEGCLFGNGERTGNVDLVTLGLNLYTQGVAPNLDFSNIDDIIETVEYCNDLPVHPRHPYAGELVFTAFSGSHQDAIKKGFEAQAARNDDYWNVPYLPIDPADLGRDYEAVIRVNSQSGKGGVAWVLDKDHGLKLPKKLQANFSQTVQSMSDDLGRELASDDIWSAFQKRYFISVDGKYKLVQHQEKLMKDGSGKRLFAGRISDSDAEISIQGSGNGLISAMTNALSDALNINIDIVDYSEHAIGTGSHATAAAYVECSVDGQGKIFGVGISQDVATASIRAILSAVNSLS